MHGKGAAMRTHEGSHVQRVEAEAQSASLRQEAGHEGRQGAARGKRTGWY